jgi:hypothetical protein
MKNVSKLILAAAVTALISTANAQSYKPTGDDGITASPRLRERLNEKAASARAAAAAPAGTITYRATALDRITASPRLREQLTERKTVISGGSKTSKIAVASSAYKPTGPNGITASPRLREQISDRSHKLAVAPVK